jgi:flavin reductase (DIM6/NTAB) family NADH-FMN oxidoreductase RutF
MSQERGTRIDADTYRTVMGHFPTGVTIITADGGEGAPVGLACNSFSSISLDPPLVSFAVARGSSTWPTIQASGRFCVNIMASIHEDLSRTFARKDVDRFAGVVHAPRAGGPGLEEAMAWIDCEIHDVSEAGDHLIVLGRVTDMEAREDEDGRPLVFYRGRYGSFDGLT